MIKRKKLIISPLMTDECRQNLVSLGFEIVDSAPLCGVQQGLRYHPDMQLACAADGVWVCAPEVFDYYKPHFDELNFRLICGTSTPQRDYPHDIAYNVAVMGRFAIHNFMHTDSVYLENLRLERVSVAQGYSKCSLCIVSGNAAITADRGIYKALSGRGADVLLIRPGFVDLPGYDCGFIGGASGLADEGLLAFCGNLDLHPDGEAIKKFCAAHGVETLSLGSKPLLDVGTIIRPA